MWPYIWRPHCIANAVEAKSQNNNSCPLCRAELFGQEDFDEDGGRLYDSGEGSENFEEAKEDEEQGEDEYDKSEEVIDAVSISSDEDEISNCRYDFGHEPTPSEYNPSNEEVDLIDHEEDNQWRTKLRQAMVVNARAPRQVKLSSGSRPTMNPLNGQPR
jgi:hypothetical protein